MTLRDLTGQRFRRLVVIHREGSDRQARATWRCLSVMSRAEHAIEHDFGKVVGGNR